MKEIINRLKSPIVIIQIISIVVGLIIYFNPTIADQVQKVSAAFVAIISILAGLNNPTDSEKF